MTDADYVLDWRKTSTSMFNESIDNAIDALIRVSMDAFAEGTLQGCHGISIVCSEISGIRNSFLRHPWYIIHIIYAFNIFLLLILFFIVNFKSDICSMIINHSFVLQYIFRKI